MIVKNILPVLPPPLPIESAQYEDPVNGIVGVGCRRPWPNHIRMDHGQEPWFRDQPSLEFFSRPLCSYSARLYRPTNNIRKALEDTNIRKDCAQERHYCYKQKKGE